MKIVAIFFGALTFILLLTQIYTGIKPSQKNSVLHRKYIWIIILILASIHVLLGVSLYGA